MTMTQGESPAPTRQPAAPGDRRCESAREALAQVLAAGQGLGEAPSLRQHLIECSDCNLVYRSSILTEARLRRALVDADVGLYQAAPVARAVLSPIQVARAGFLSQGPGKVKAAWVIALAVLFYVTVRLTPAPSGATHARLQALSGEVHANGRSLILNSPTAELSRGDWVSSEPGARARLEFGDTVVEVAASTQLQIEEPAAGRLRLESGALVIDGPLWVSSVFGLVEVLEGRASLRVDGQGLQVRSDQGVVRAIDSRGEHRLLVGERLTLAGPR